MKKQEKLAMIKSAIITLALHDSLDTSAKHRGIKSLKQAYRKHAKPLKT